MAELDLSLNKIRDSLSGGWATTAICSACYIISPTGRWRTRLWVLQEAQVANNDSIVKCGEDEVPWLLFHRAVLCLQRKTSGIPKNLRSRLAVHALTVDFLVRAPLEEQLPISSGQHCRDPSDRICGVLSIAPPRLASKIKPNYVLRTMEIYKQAFLVYARHYQRLTLLQHYNYPDRLFPSWVPNWAFSVGSQATYYGRRASGISSARFYVLRNRPCADAVRFAAVLKAETAEVQSRQDVLEYLRTIGTENLQHTAYPAGGWKWSRDDPVRCVKYRNKLTCPEIDSDPRLLPEALRGRGIRLETLGLI
ncbi:hypothetical protein DL768_011855 [Monosporascus sp. mg162]|nr:hypothetical protein DL768_011855 [Monosporascus sp. mg162]